jgi:transposase
LNGLLLARPLTIVNIIEAEMEVYKNFIGIDIGKLSFVVAIYGSKKVREYENNPEGMGDFLKDYQTKLPNSFIVLETTGGYEMRLLLTLCEQGFAVHRANTRKVKNFIRSLSNGAKTDPLDGKALALYGYERHARLELFKPQSAQSLELYELVQRCNDLKFMLVAEKNRLKAPRNDYIKTSCQLMISALTNEVDALMLRINQIIENDVLLKKKKEVLKTIPGIGEVTANYLLVLLPELGALNRKQVASLTGLAPIANDSGLYKGYRATGHGRSGIKPILFMAAMAARNSNSWLKGFYKRLIDAGKKKIVALTALMRKMIVIANARIRDFNLSLPQTF